MLLYILVLFFFYFYLFFYFLFFFFFFFNDTATTEIYTLSLHDALPIYVKGDAVIKLHRTLEILEVQSVRCFPTAFCVCLGGGWRADCKRKMRVLVVP